MALTFTRWIAAAILGCALVLVVMTRIEWRAQVPNDPQLTDLFYRDGLAKGHVVAAAERLRILGIRDSLQASLKQSGGNARVVIDAAMPAQLRQPIADLVAMVDRERGVAPRYPGVMAFVFDTVRAVRGQNVGYWSGFLVVDHLLPAEPGGPCITVARVRGGSTREAKITLLNDATVARLLGPCAFYEAFGPPGAGIARWLADGGWNFAQAGSWQRDVGRWDAVGAWRSAGLGRDDGRSLALRSAATPAGVQCAAGDRSACRAALAAEVNTQQSVNAPSLVWGSVVSPRITQRLYNGYIFAPRPLGPHEISYLGDMVHAIGAAKFARFWSSAEAPPAAFRAATGVELDDWTMQWMRLAYGAQHRGPGAATSRVLVAALLAAIAGGAAVFAMTRRQIAA